MLKKSFRVLLLAALSSTFAACGDPSLAGDYPQGALDDEDRFIEDETRQQTALEAAADCVTVSNGRELMIRHLAVVNDPVRTKWTGGLTSASDGAWHFGRLMRNMAGSQDPAAFTTSLFNKWSVNQTVNGQTVGKRTAISTVLDAWPKKADGVTLDITKAPLRLLAIVNRMDLRRLSQGNAGEGRFVFGVVDSVGNPLQFTVILEYKLPAATQADVLRWATDWHSLSALDPASETYKAKLQSITDRFTKRGAMPARPNGSAIGQIRTNEIALASPWQLREFRLNSAGAIVETTVVNTPAIGFNGTGTLANWINANESAILREAHTVPAQLNIGGVDKPFRAGAIRNNIDFWSAPGIRSATARHKFSLNTCNGCHGAETNTGFLHVFPRAANQAAALSGFLTGIDVIDPVTGATRRFNDLARRATDLKTLLCSSTTASFEATTERVH